MPYGKRHFYRLEGESLEALNKLVEYDTLLTDFRMSDLRKKIAQAMGKPGVVNDDEALTKKLSFQFTGAQVREYKDKLGFNDPPVQVRKYGDGILYRAFQAFPRMAMNPGTSKANFGLGDLLKKKDRKPEDRIVIYTAYEDYKGQHFAPPGAIKLTDEEYESYQPQKDSFEYYRTYDEGAPLPADFDPNKHQTEFQPLGDYLNFSDVFLVTGEAHDNLVAYDKAVYDWPMVYQDFRDKDMPPLLAQLTPLSHVLNSWIIESEKPGDPRMVSFDRVDTYDWELMKDGLLQAFTLHKLIPGKMDTCELQLIPRADTPIGQQIVAALAKVPPHPVKTVDFGFEERPSLQNSAVFDDKISGFPYMKIERFERGDVKLLVFRLPPNVKTVDTPESCTRISLDDYIALGGAADDPPSHVFSIEGEAHDKISAFDRSLVEYNERGTAFRNAVTSMLQTAAPGATIDEFDLCSYKTNGPRELRVTMPALVYAAAEAVIADHFKIDFARDGYGPRQDRVYATLHSQTETENGRAMAALLESVPYEPYWTTEMDRPFGFLSNKGYDHMVVEKLRGLSQHAVVYKLPPYIHDIEPPPGTQRITLEEFTLLFAESCDVNASSPLPPRPEHLKHLPTIEGAKSYEQIQDLKKEKDESGLPLHERTEFDWFKLRY